MIAYTLGEYANGDAWKEILVAYNGNRHQAEFHIPEADWTVVCGDGPDRSRRRDRMPGGIVRIAPSSAIIAYRE